VRKIDKGLEPEELRVWKRKNSNGVYGDLTSLERQAIRAACTTEQFYLCAYCCQAISGTETDTMNEHVEAKHLAPQKSLDFNNIVVSCTTPKQCDAAHKSQALPLTPLMAECETELHFKISGRVEGLTDRAKETIRILNLGDFEKNNKSLIEKRKQLSYSLLFQNGINPDEGLEDEELLRSVIDDINRPKDGKLMPYAPVVTNLLRGWLLH